MAFRTFDLDLALSLGNTYLLSAARTAVDVMGLSLLHQILFFIEAKTELRRHLKEFLIFGITLLDISGKNTYICIYDRCDPENVKGAADSSAEYIGKHCQNDKCRNWRCHRLT